MTVLEKLRAIAGELSDEYILVAKVDNTVGYFCSNCEFAEEVLPNIQETIAEWRRVEGARDLKHHHRDRPKTDGDKKEGDS